MPNEIRNTASASRATSGFPGGTARLPRLNSRLHQGGEARRVSYVGTAFVRTPRSSGAPADSTSAGTATPTRTVTTEPPPEPAKFTEYYTYESLFTTPPEVDESVEIIDEAAFETLGLEADAGWDEVVTAYRRIVKQAHPDLLVGASAEELDAANERIAKVNFAYSRLNALFRLVADTNDESTGGFNEAG
jgi:hypothetical protein